MGYAGCSECCPATPLESFDIGTDDEGEEEQECSACIEWPDEKADEPQLAAVASCLALDAEEVQREEANTSRVAPVRAAP